LTSASASRQFTIQARDSSSTAQTAGGDFWAVDIFSASYLGFCLPSASQPNCAVVCAPAVSPHTPSPSCISTLPRPVAAAGAVTPSQWVRATVTDLGTGQYTVNWLPQAVGVYDAHVAQVTSAFGPSAADLSLFCSNSVWRLMHTHIPPAQAAV
jgi:hypothetical protein